MFTASGSAAAPREDLAVTEDLGMAEDIPVAEEPAPMPSPPTAQAAGNSSPHTATISAADARGADKPAGGRGRRVPASVTSVIP
ncbi:hypothetical protein [Frankia sp. Allo2]|uniref:hypothetical protein n=1 Tax=Frankia sp. Allo2 TaxID=981405 RepID=UPI001E4A81FF|nr:hypothetical protein [Frankia sp. Allo2]